MYTYATVDLVMQSNFLVKEVIIACHLYSVHPQVSIHDAGFISIFGIYLRHGDKRAAILWPVYNLGQVADVAPAKINRRITAGFHWQGRLGSKFYICIFK